VGIVIFVMAVVPLYIRSITLNDLASSDVGPIGCSLEIKLIRGVYASGIPVLHLTDTNHVGGRFFGETFGE